MGEMKSKVQRDRLKIILSSTVFWALIPSAGYCQVSITGGLPKVLLQDDNGVDLKTGSIVRPNRILTIGPKDEPDLSYEIAPTWTDRFGGTPLNISLTMTNCPYGMSNVTTGCWVEYHADIGTEHYYFGTDRSGLPGVASNGAKLDREGSDLVITKSNGDKWYFTPKSWNGSSAGTSVLGSIKYMTKPDGTRLTYYTNGIVANTGYLLHFDNGSRASVSLINLAVDDCDANALACSNLTQNWPKVVVTGATNSYPSSGYTTNYTENSGKLTAVEVTNLSPYRTKTKITSPGGVSYTYIYSTINASNTGGSAHVIESFEDLNGTTAYTYNFERLAHVSHTLSTRQSGRHFEYNLTLARPYTGGDVAPSAYTQTITNSLNKVTTLKFLRTQMPSSYWPIEGSLLYISYPEGKSVTAGYNARNQLTSVNAVPNTADTQSLPVSSSATYSDNCSNWVLCASPVTVTDGRQISTEYTYNDYGLVSTKTFPSDQFGRRRRETYNYSALSATYNVVGGGAVPQIQKLTSISICPDVTACAGTVNEIIKQYEYDANLRQVAEIDRDGTGLYRIQRTSYDAVGNVTKTDGPAEGEADSIYYFYDDARQMTGIIKPLPGTDGLPRPAVRYAYDGDGRVTSIESGTVSGTTSADLASMVIINKSIIKYDNLGRKTKEEIKNGDQTYAVTQISYDTDNQIICTAVRMDPAQWDVQGDACLPQLDGPNGADRITKNEYDAAGHLIQVRQAVGTPLEQAYATYTYSENGSKEYVIDANGNRAKMEYDGFDRLRNWIFPSKTAPALYAPVNQVDALAQAGGINSADYEQYSYDANGNRLTLRKRDGSLLSYEYDGLNRVTKKLVPERSGLAGAATRDVYYAYDLQGHQTDARFDSLTGEGLHTTFDGFGREISNTLTMDSVARSVSYQYDASSNRTMATQPDGAFARYAYDGLDRLKQAWWGWAGLTDEQQFVTVSYKSNGLRDTIARGMSSTAYGYDNAQRLSDLSLSFFTGTGNLAQTFAYNPAGQMTDESVSNNAYSYKARVNVNRAYGVNGLNQYNSIAGRSFCYDANGSLTADGTFVYLYDVENRLVEKRAQTNTDCSALAYTGSIKASLRYDPMGRLYETVGDITGTTRMAYDGDKLIGEYNAAGNLLRRYLWGDRIDEPLVWDEGGLLNCSGTRFLAGNHQGSIIATADCQGNLTRTFAYDEYGIPEAGDATPLTPTNGARFLYTGQAFQPDLGMYYYKARMYSPTLGRFMQTDPIGYDDQINLYAYVANDSVNGTDSSGLWTCAGGQTSANCGEVRNRLAQMVKDSNSEKLSKSQKADLRQLVNLAGKEGDKGVEFSFDQKSFDACSKGASAGGCTGSEGNGSQINVHLVPGFSHQVLQVGMPKRTQNDAVDREGIIAHELRHGQYMRSHGGRSELTSDPASHLPAYRSEDIVHKAHGTLSGHDVTECPGQGNCYAR